MEYTWNSVPFAGHEIMGVVFTALHTSVGVPTSTALGSFYRGVRFVPQIVSKMYSEVFLGLLGILDALLIYGMLNQFPSEASGDYVNWPVVWGRLKTHPVERTRKFNITVFLNTEIPLITGLVAAAGELAFGILSEIFGESSPTQKEGTYRFIAYLPLLLANAVIHLVLANIYADKYFDLRMEVLGW